MPIHIVNFAVVETTILKILAEFQYNIAYYITSFYKLVLTKHILAHFYYHMNEI